MLKNTSFGDFDAGYSKEIADKKPTPVRFPSVAGERVPQSISVVNRDETVWRKHSLRMYFRKLMAIGSLFLGIDSSGGIDYAMELIPRRNIVLLYENF